LEDQKSNVTGAEEEEITKLSLGRHSERKKWMETEKAMKALMTLEARSNNNWCPPAINAAPAPLASLSMARRSYYGSYRMQLYLDKKESLWLVKQSCATALVVYKSFNGVK